MDKKKKDAEDEEEEACVGARRMALSFMGAMKEKVEERGVRRVYAG